jgi:hypothetical protein
VPQYVERLVEERRMPNRAALVVGDISAIATVLRACSALHQRIETSIARLEEL